MNSEGENIEITNNKKNLPKKKWVKKTILILVSILVFLFLTATITAYVFEDEIADVVLKELYKSIETEINHEEVSFSLIRKFPMASLKIKKMQVKGLSENRDLLFADYVFLQFNLMDILTSNYKVKRIEINDAVLRLKVFKNGVANWDVFTIKDTSDTDFALNLNAIVLQNIQVSYENLTNEIEFGVSVRDLNAKGDFAKQKFDLQLSTDFLLDSLHVDTSFTLTNKQFISSVKIHIDTENKEYKLKQGEIQMDKLLFLADVDLNNKNEDWYYLVKLKGNEIALKDVLVHMPASINKSLEMYELEGLLKIQIDAEGQTGNKKDLDIKSTFALKKGKIKNTKNNIGLTNVKLSGSFTSSSLDIRKTAVLEIVDIAALLNKKTISGSILVKNFISPFVCLHLLSDVNLADWNRFMPESYIYKSEGDAKIEIDFQNQFISLATITANDFKTAIIKGTIVFSDVLLQLVQEEAVFENISGTVGFKDQFLYLDDLNGTINGNSFLLNGKIENFFDYVLNPGGTMTISANVSSPYLNLNKFLAQSDNSNKKKDEDEFELVFPKDINFNFILNINKFVFDDFEAKNIRGEAVLKNHVFTVNDLGLSAFGGNVDVSGYLQENKDRTFGMYCNAKLNNVDVQQMFYSFHNFGQSENGITDKNIRGQASSNILFKAKAKNNLSILLESVDVLASISIDNGQLINFHPLESLSKFVDLEDLRNIRFATLKNSIQILNKVITIPEMEIKNNAMNLVLSGYQNFKCDINYNIKLRLNDLLAKKMQKKKKDADDFGEVVSDGTGNTYIHILATGNLDDPNFKWSNRKANAGVKEQVKEQKQEFKTIFKQEKDSVANAKQKDKDLNDYKKKAVEIEIDENW